MTDKRLVGWDSAVHGFRKSVAIRKHKWKYLRFGGLLQAKSIADPFDYDAYIEKQKKEKLEKLQRERITVSFVLRNYFSCFYFSDPKILLCFIEWCNFLSSSVLLS